MLKTDKCNPVVDKILESFKESVQVTDKHSKLRNQGANIKQQGDKTFAKLGTAPRNRNKMRLFQRP